MGEAVAKGEGGGVKVLFECIGDFGRVLEDLIWDRGELGGGSVALVMGTEKERRHVRYRGSVGRRLTSLMCEIRKG